VLLASGGEGVIEVIRSDCNVPRMQWKWRGKIAALPMKLRQGVDVEVEEAINLE